MDEEITMEDYKSQVADWILDAQDGNVTAIAWVFGNGMKMLCEHVGLPYSEALRMALEDLWEPE